MGDAGAGLGIVLLAVSRYGTAQRCRDRRRPRRCADAHAPARSLGGRLVDAADDARRPLALGCVWYATLLLGGAALLRSGRPWPAAACLLAAGAAGPLLTGGLSSLVRRLAGSPARARSADALTYGVAGTAAPGLVAAVAVVWTPLGAVATTAALRRGRGRAAVARAAATAGTGRPSRRAAPLGGVVAVLGARAAPGDGHDGGGCVRRRRAGGARDPTRPTS